MARAVHQKTRKPEKIERHEMAPRPFLPDPVRATLRLDAEAEKASEKRDRSTRACPVLENDIGL